MTISSIFFTTERMNGAVTLVSLVTVHSQPVVAIYLRQLSEAHLGSVILSAQNILAKQVKLSDLSKDGLSLFEFIQIGDEFIYLQ